MGRQEQPLDAGDGPLVLFALELRELRRQAGSPPYRRLAARTNYSASTLAEAAAGRRLPSDAVLAAFVAACGGDPQEWERRRVRTHRLITRPLVAAGPPGRTVAGAEVAAEVAVAEATTDKPTDKPAEEPAAVTTAATGAGMNGAASGGPPAAGVRTAPRYGHRRRPVVLRRAFGSAGAVLFALTFGICVQGDSPASGAMAPVSAGAPAQDPARWLRPGTDVPARYRGPIIEAGTGCFEPEVTPALIAAMLKAESGFDPDLSDPAADEYGIARWTPRVLRHYLPAGRQETVPEPPFSAEDSILAVGRMLCAIAPELRGVEGDPALNLAAAYRTSTWVVRGYDEARLASIRPYLDQVRGNIERYRPVRPEPRRR
ncbi:helix-turn-helix domain-containing protein [Kitasatospora sp. NPDC001547]|uniref:helix-turn-helix domain-containing protein n=1 Tax=Kitasatospora sp. NPDC001547 TaxID=3364015 RepID=UPI0036CB6B12